MVAESVDSRVIIATYKTMKMSSKITISLSDMFTTFSSKQIKRKYVLAYTVYIEYLYLGF